MSNIKVSISKQIVNVKVSAKTKPNVNAEIIPSNIKTTLEVNNSKII